MCFTNLTKEKKKKKKKKKKEKFETLIDKIKNYGHFLKYSINFGYFYVFFHILLLELTLNRFGRPYHTF